MDTPTLTEGLTPSSSTDSFAKETTGMSHVDITAALLALVPSAALTANIPQAAAVRAASSSSRKLSAQPLGQPGKKTVRFSEPLVTFSIAHSKIDLDDFDLESVLTADLGDNDGLVDLDLGLPGDNTNNDNNNLDLDLDLDSDNDDSTRNGVLLSDDEDEDAEDEDDDADEGHLDNTTTTNDNMATTTPAPKRGLTRATRRPMALPDGTVKDNKDKRSSQLVDELDLLRSKRLQLQQRHSNPQVKQKGILKISDQPPPQIPLSPPLSPKRTQRSSHSSLLVKMALNPEAKPIDSTSPPRRATTTISRPSSNSTLNGSGKKKTQVSRATFEQSAMYLNF
ncbi:UNVERIFIED_CONTAM: hypothetical protein HDU68_010142 [Siphonaria sp. JEL0065]|nr:hypothetical protein HDU68_010142 [Siphonaria sp. JEL0065]